MLSCSLVFILSKEFLVSLMHYDAYILLYIHVNCSEGLRWKIAEIILINMNISVSINSVLPLLTNGYIVFQL